MCNTREDNAAELAREEATPVIPITRQELIDKMIEDRGANWDYSDTCEMLEYGRTGFVEMTNKDLEEIAEDYCLCDDDGNDVRYTITDADTSKPSAEALLKEAVEALKATQTVLDGWEHTLRDRIGNANYVRIASANRQVIAKAAGV